MGAFSEEYPRHPIELRSIGSEFSVEVREHLLIASNHFRSSSQFREIAFQTQAFRQVALLLYQNQVGHQGEGNLLGGVDGDGLVVGVTCGIRRIEGELVAMHSRRGRIGLGPGAGQVTGRGAREPADCGVEPAAGGIPDEDYRGPRPVGGSRSP